MLTNYLIPFARPTLGKETSPPSTCTDRSRHFRAAVRSVPASIRPHVQLHPMPDVTQLEQHSCLRKAPRNKMPSHLASIYSGRLIMPCRSAYTETWPRVK